MEDAIERALGELEIEFGVPRRILSTLVREARVGALREAANAQCVLCQEGIEFGRGYHRKTEPLYGTGAMTCGAVYIRRLIAAAEESGQ